MKAARNADEADDGRRGQGCRPRKHRMIFRRDSGDDNQGSLQHTFVRLNSRKVAGETEIEGEEPERLREQLEPHDAHEMPSAKQVARPNAGWFGKLTTLGPSREYARHGRITSQFARRVPRRADTCRQNGGGSPVLERFDRWLQVRLASIYAPARQECVTPPARRLGTEFGGARDGSLHSRRSRAAEKDLFPIGAWPRGGIWRR